ncbi:unnamed protein product [Lymnaea stagnalis]|uniref:Uncharacterized protein n=1 Tax=Lymnaea stagnalis TaxID=6523 RepID=A0AAV2H8P7_LYMST
MTEVKMKRVGLRLVAGVIISLLVVVSIRRQYNAAKELQRRKALTFAPTEQRKSELVVPGSDPTHDTKDPDDSLDDFIDVMPAHLKNDEETEGEEREDDLTLTRPRSGVVNTGLQQSAETSLRGENKAGNVEPGGDETRQVPAFEVDETEESIDDVDSVVYETVDETPQQESLLSSFFGLKKFLPFGGNSENKDVNGTSNAGDEDRHDSRVGGKDDISASHDGGRDLPLAYDTLNERVEQGAEVEQRQVNQDGEQRQVNQDGEQRQVNQDGVPLVKAAFGADYGSERVATVNNDAAESDATDAHRDHDSDATDAHRGHDSDTIEDMNGGPAKANRSILAQKGEEPILSETRVASDGGNIAGYPASNQLVGQNNNDLLGKQDSNSLGGQNSNDIVGQNSNGIVGQNSNDVVGQNNNVIVGQYGNHIVGQQDLHIPIGQLDRPVSLQHDVTNDTSQFDSSNLIQKQKNTDNVGPDNSDVAGQPELSNVEKPGFTDQLQAANSLATNEPQNAQNQLKLKQEKLPRQAETRDQLLREKLSPEILRILLDNNLGPNFLKSFPLVWRYLAMERSATRNHLVDMKHEPNGIMPLSENPNKIRSDPKESTIGTALEVVPEQKGINSQSLPLVPSLPPLTAIDVLFNDNEVEPKVAGHPIVDDNNGMGTSTATPDGGSLYDNPRPLSDNEFALLRTHPSLANNAQATVFPVRQPLSSEQLDNNPQQQQHVLTPQLSDGTSFLEQQQEPEHQEHQQQRQRLPEQQETQEQYQQQLPEEQQHYQQQSQEQQQQNQQQLQEQQQQYQQQLPEQQQPQQQQNQQGYQEQIPLHQQQYLGELTELQQNQQQLLLQQQPQQQYQQQEQYEQQQTYQQQLSEQQQYQQRLLLQQQPQQQYQQQEQYEQQQPYQQPLPEHQQQYQQPLQEQQQQYQEQLPEQQQIAELNQTSLSDHQTIQCPRDVKLAKTSHPVTALVAFPGAEAAWVRDILEQLFGEPTDSIYTIMADLKSGNAASVYQMGKKVAVQTHSASDKNFQRALLLISNPYAVEKQHQLFRPPFQDWQKRYLWGQTYSSWFNSSLPLFVLVYEDLVENPMAELIKVTEFLGTEDRQVSYECAMDVARRPPSRIGDVAQITGLYNPERRRINANIDTVMTAAQGKHPGLVARLDSFKVF